MKSKKIIVILAAFVVLMTFSLVSWCVLPRGPVRDTITQFFGYTNSVHASQEVKRVNKDGIPKFDSLISDSEFMKQVREKGLNEELLGLALKRIPQLKEISNEPGWVNKWPEVAKERERTLDAIKKFAKTGIWEVAVAMVNMELPVSEDSPDGWATTLPVLDFLKESLANNKSPSLESLIVKQVIQDTRSARAAGDLKLVAEERRRLNTLIKLLERTLATADEYNRMDRSKWIPSLAERNGGGFELEQILLDSAPTIRP